MKKVNLFVGTLSGGGAERAVSNISLNLSPEIEREIILFGDNAKIDYPYEGKINNLDNIKLSNFARKIVALVLRIKKINILKNNNSEATTISFLEYPNLINCITNRSGKSIVSVRNHMSTKYKSGIKAFVWNNTVSRLYSKTDLIVVVSKEIKKDLIENYGIVPEKVKVIYNSYPVDNIKKISEEPIEEYYRHIFESPVVITSGRLNKQKGHWHLIRAFYEVKKSINNLKLVILGEGALKEKLIELSKSLGIYSDIYFLGFQKNPFKYIKRSKVFVMTSLHEGFPNSLAEAMACGVPIISTDCLSGPREIIAPKEIGIEPFNYSLEKKRYGILTPVCDGIMYGAQDILTKEERILANHLIKLLQDDDIYRHFSDQSEKRIEDFNIDNIIKHWEALI